MLWKGMAHALYWKANAAYYEPYNTLAGRLVLERCAAMLRELRPRRAISNNPISDKVIYADADTETMIIAIAVFDWRGFDEAATISDAYMEVARDARQALSSSTSLIWGLVLIALIETVSDHRVDLRIKSVAFYTGDKASEMALTQGYSKCRVAAIPVRIFL